MMRHRLMLPKWGPVINSLEQLITNAAALESLLEGGPSALHPQLCGGHRVPPGRVPQHGRSVWRKSCCISWQGRLALLVGSLQLVPM